MGVILLVLFVLLAALIAMAAFAGAGALYRFFRSTRGFVPKWSLRHTPEPDRLQRLWSSGGDETGALYWDRAKQELIVKHGEGTHHITPEYVVYSHAPQGRG